MGIMSKGGKGESRGTAACTFNRRRSGTVLMDCTPRRVTLSEIKGNRRRRRRRFGICVLYTVLLMRRVFYNVIVNFVDVIT